MISLEKKIADVVLTRIRKRRERIDESSRNPGTQRAATVARARIREASFSDFQAVWALKKRWGLIPDSFENWKRLWQKNPALLDCAAPLPIGWVLEADGKVVGYLGNIASTYRYGDRTLIAVTGHGLVVEPEHRSLSAALNGAFYRQKYVDLYLSTTAIEVVGKIARVFKSDPLPQPDYDVFFWVLNSSVFVRNVLTKLGLGPSMSKLGGVLGSIVISGDKHLNKRWPRQRSTPSEVKEIKVSDISDDFGVLWAEKLGEGPRLLADRSPDTLRWHFNTPDDMGRTQIFCCYRAGRLFGYIAVRTEPVSTSGIRRAIVVDLIAKNDDPDTIGVLFDAAYGAARATGCDVLEVLGFPEAVRNVFCQGNPYVRRYPSCPFLYKAADAGFHKVLAASSSWYASPFDGDTSLMPFLTDTLD